MDIKPIINWNIELPEGYVQPELIEAGERRIISGILTNDIFSDQLMTNMEYYYRRGKKYFFRNDLGTFTLCTDDGSNLKWKERYDIESN